MKPDTTLQLSRLEPEEEMPVTNPLRMLDRMTQGPISKDGAEGIKVVAELVLQFEDRAARRTAAEAFCDLMQELKTFQATRTVPDKHGNAKFAVLPFDEIDEKLRPIALKYGFSYWFSEAPARDRQIGTTCHIMHRSGHERTNDFYVRQSNALPGGSTDNQNDMATHSYARRGALCEGFSIVIDRGLGEDPRMEGSPITDDEAKRIWSILGTVDVNWTAFCKYAHIQNAGPSKNLQAIQSIPSSRLKDVDEMLTRKANEKK